SLVRQWFEHRNSTLGSPRGHAARHWLFVLRHELTVGCLRKRLVLISSGARRSSRNSPRVTVLFPGSVIRYVPLKLVRSQFPSRRNVTPFAMRASTVQRP